MSDQTRVEELEIKVAYLESLHEELNEVVTQLQTENMQLKEALLEIRDHLQNSNPGEQGSSATSLFAQMQDEKPPHY